MENKTCTKCDICKPIEDFYYCCERYRSECKSCTIKINSLYQIRYRKQKYVKEKKKVYSKKYYHLNKQKFREYRLKFEAKYPDYQRNYHKIWRKKGDTANNSVPPQLETL